MHIKKPTSLFFDSAGKGVLQIYVAGKLYAIKPFEEGIFKFNFPVVGKYHFRGDTQLLKLKESKPLEKWNKTIPLPKKERNKDVGIKKFLINFGMSSPARIYTDKKIFVVNSKWFEFPIEVRFFILLHELGHYYYKTEWKCDQYAAHWFIKLGFNPSQAFEAIAGTLCDSARNDERIIKIYENLVK